MPLLKMINRVEELDLDELSDDDMLDLIASLIKSGEVWQLNGSFRDVATRLIDEGYIDRAGMVLRHL